MAWLLFLSLVMTRTWACSMVHDDDDNEGDCCAHVSECPSEPCHTVECLPSVGCSYDRLPVTECCRSDEECCSYASDTEIGICGASHTCSFYSTLSLQCTVDRDCLALREGFECRSRGECHEAVCQDGFCGCVDTTDSDFDHDGVACPGDCNNVDPQVQETILCYADVDGDGYPNCQMCQELCVPAGYACPVGYVGYHTGSRMPAPTFTVVGACAAELMTDSTSLSDFPYPDSAFETSSSSSYSSRSESDLSKMLCDCCDHDALAFPRSPHAALTPTACGSFDYNCDGKEFTYACCVDGHPTDDDSRIVWSTSDCEGAGLIGRTVQCGACETLSNFNEILDEFVYDFSRRAGFNCRDDCPASTLALPRTLDSSCPATCYGSSICTMYGDSLSVGDCSSYVVDCNPYETDPPIYGDDLSCCQLAAN